MGYLDDQNEVFDEDYELHGQKKEPLTENKLLLIVGIITSVVAIPLVILKLVEGLNILDVIVCYLAAVLGIFLIKLINMKQKEPLTENKMLLIIGGITTIAAVPFVIVKWVNGGNPSDVIATYFAAVAGILWAKLISCGKKSLIRWTVIASLMSLGFLGFVLMDIFKAVS